ncbi:acylphosphatase [Pedobacter metabolipauper]|uniref:acylphosphatase n=1 Tax=Pedobacter metabolipauper TaxID=425513 RepID=A0A4R6SW66_9SPHI|nr:acylphosphatase [Pedobacter metabolipauper]TDQ10060.1 acylphosphatase [Pedobacter metabolipauper]
MEIRHIDIKITGKVQGVSFRQTTKAVADQMGVRGIARNQKDGSLYLEAEGDDTLLEMFVEWCHEGPDRSKIELVEVTPGELKNYRNFEIIKK